MDYEDLRFQQRCLREETFFDAGFVLGQLAGRAHERYGAETAALAVALQGTVMASGAGREQARAALLEILWAMSTRT